MTHVGGVETVIVRVPFVVRRRGGRKLILAPDGTVTDPGRPQIDNTMVKALARAFRWRKLMESGVYGTVGEIAAAENINSSYVSRVLRLTLLAPEIVEAILAGRQPAETTLAGLMGGVFGGVEGAEARASAWLCGFADWRIFPSWNNAVKSRESVRQTLQQGRPVTCAPPTQS